MSPERIAVLRKLFARTNGRAWEPPDPRHPLLIEAITEGFLRRVDGVCGFERLRDAMVTWTTAARIAFASEPG